VRSFTLLRSRSQATTEFAGYSYFELGDFVTPALRIFKEVGLTSVIRFEQDLATMEIVNTGQAGGEDCHHQPDV
jgi:hypothetical protein